MSDSMHCPLASPQLPNAWAAASAAAIRFQEIQQKVKEESMRDGNPEDQANDLGQVAAWLDRYARDGGLRVTRTTADEGRIAHHIVELLDENEDGEVVSIECGGYAYKSELCRGACGGTEWLSEKKEVSEGWFEITVMITDRFPDHPMFKRADGSNIVLDPYTDDHFHMAKVVICECDLVDNVDPCDCRNCERRRSAKH